MVKYFFLLTLALNVLFFQGLAQNNYKEISLPSLMEKLKSGNGNMVIVDVRTKGEYNDTLSQGRQLNLGHIKGAINLELNELQQNPEAVKKLDAYRDKEIYLICSHSYRSRAASNILLQNGFQHVNNVRGGMTEWYRNYDELSPYKSAYLATGISYKNISPSQLYSEIKNKKDVLLIGFTSTPHFFYDSLNILFYKYLPTFKNAVFVTPADSVKVMELAKNAKGKQIVTFNITNNGAAEAAEWLTKKGISNVSYLVGNLNLFYEYITNNHLKAAVNNVMRDQSSISFITPVILCNYFDKKENIQLVDIRHDTLFNKINRGTKHDFRNLKGSVNFFAEKGTRAFEKSFPDKQMHYVLITQNGITGLEFADELTRKGYHIEWVIGGLQRWEWYVNNIEGFKCGDYFVL